MQDADTSDMIFNVPTLLAYLSERVVLRPGDVVLTGSPHGNGTHYNRYLKPGDVMDASITGLGAQRTRCVAEN
jgi:2,4-diketo-3-deoxy-L-fuconate hydrolase